MRRTVRLPNGRTVRVLYARTPQARMRGLIGYGPSDTDGCLLFPCSAVHMAGIRFPLDIVWLDARGRVLRVDRAVPPGLRVRACRGARAALELWSGLVDGVEPGARVGWMAPGALAELAWEAYLGRTDGLLEAVRAFGGQVLPPEFGSVVVRSPGGTIRRSPQMTLWQVAAAAAAQVLAGRDGGV